MDIKDLKRRTVSDKILRDKAFNIAKSPKYDEYKKGLVSMVYKFLMKSPLQVVVLLIMRIKKNLQLAEELYKPIIRNFLKKTVYSGFKRNIWGYDLVDMQLISKLNKGFRFLLCVFEVFSKYAWIVALKDKKGLSIVNAFQKMLNESTKMLVDKGSKFSNNSNNSFKNLSKDNHVEMFSILNEGKYVVG